MAQGTNYNEPFFYHRIVNVGWGGGYAILEITAPSGMSFLFGDYSLTGSVPTVFSKPDIINAVMGVPLDDPIVGNLYDITEEYYLIGTVVFPDRVAPDPFAYNVIKASIHPPDRFVEPTDLRTLSDNEFPYQIEGWPTDGNWSDPTFVWGTWSDGRPAYLPSSSGADPGAPGYYINPNWGLGEAYQTSERKRDLYKYAFVLDFTSAEDRIGNGTVDLSISSPGHDDDLGGFSMTLSLRVFASTAVFTAGASSVTATIPPSITQSKSASYEQAGTIASITSRGFV